MSLTPKHRFKAVLSLCFFCGPGSKTGQTNQVKNREVKLETGRGQDQLGKHRLDNKDYTSTKAIWQMAAETGLLHTVYQEGDETMNSRCAGGCKVR